MSHFPSFRLRPVESNPISWVTGTQTSFIGSQVYFWAFIILGVAVYHFLYVSAPGGVFQKLFPSVESLSREVVRLVAGDPWRLPGDPLIWGHLWASLYRIVPWILFGAAAGYAAGLGSVVIPPIAAVVQNLLPLLFATSRMSLFLILIPVLGFFEAPKRALSVWIGFIYIYTAVFSHSSALLKGSGKDGTATLGEFAAVVGMTRWRLVRYCLFPLSLPAFFVSLEMAVSHAWTLLVFTESFTASRGIGYLIYLAHTQAEYALLYLATFVLACCNLLSWGAIRFARQIALRRW